MIPTTSWIRDKGTTIELDTGVLVDELGNYFVDESGNNLLDSPSSDGVYPAHSWLNNSTEIVNTSWADSFEPRTSEYTRTTVQGDTRTTVQGDTRVALTSATNRQPNTSWSGDEYV